MSMIARRPARRGFALTTDMTLGVFGFCLAGASAAFGIGMIVHGPLAGWGTSGNFTVFAQLAPRGRPSAGSRRQQFDDLDETATASIPRPGAPRQPFGGQVTLQATGADTASIVLDGQARIVHVGDVVPELGTILAIVGGAKPMVRTTRGVIASSD